LDPNAALELPFELTVERRADEVRLILKGELDLAAKEEYEQELRKLEHDESVESVVVDLRGLTFIDSTGIRLLLITLRASEGNGFTAAFVQGNGPVRDLLETTGVARQLPLVDESALS
jgi:anti-anti-sigma factor